MRGTDTYRKELLEELQEKMDTEYISDLRLIQYGKKLANALRQIAPLSYPFSEWKEAFEYILGYNPCCRTSADIREKLILKLEEM